MQRCLELAARGRGNVAPNPMVGAVLVYDDNIIGEGWHQQYGEAHAEVNAIHQAIQNGHANLSQATLYVSLEPCAHFGKTPPCVDLIIQQKIPHVVIGCRDPFEEVNGKGIEKLQAAGVKVETGILENECKELNKRFFTFHTKQRPYIILKWAETGDGFIAGQKTSPNFSEGKTSLPSEGGFLESLNTGVDSKLSGSKAPLAEVGGLRLFISNEYSNRLVHQWRSEETAILIGTNTALQDNPSLTTRLWPGKSPIRLVLDMNLRLPNSLKIFNGEERTIVFNAVKQEEKNNLLYYKIEKRNDIIAQLMKALYDLKIQSVIVEGGAKFLQSFIDEGLWDEARVIKNEELVINNGLNAPILSKAQIVSEKKILTDKIEIYTPKHSRLTTND